MTVFIAMGMTVFLGATALAVDIGYLANVRTESQRVADLASMAGAAAFIHAQGNVDDVARDWAIHFAAQNMVDQSPVNLHRVTDIEVDAAAERVSVTVRHTEARGNPITTVFARMLGVSSVDIVTFAAAEATAASALTCPLPFAVADLWREEGGDPDRMEPDQDAYVAWAPDGSADATFTGYANLNVGDAVSIYPHQGAGPAHRAWFYPLADPAMSIDYRSWVNSCPNPQRPFALGQSIPSEVLDLATTTLQGLDDLIALDPNAVWDPSQLCVADAVGEPCRSSPRVRALPLFAPTPIPDPGVGAYTITNFAGVFVVAVESGSANLIVTGYSGVAPAPHAGPTPVPFKVVRLVG
jgi:hypothetical protein